MEESLICEGKLIIEESTNAILKQYYVSSTVLTLVPGHLSFTKANGKHGKIDGKYFIFILYLIIQYSSIKQLSGSC
jgi:hypothetical protein